MQMVATGWIADEPDAGAPALPVTQMLLARQQHRAGPLETALARSRANEIREAREAAAFAPDPDERAAALVSRGYTPGLASQLAQRLGDTMAEIEAENEKIEKAARRAQFAAREHAAGRADVSRMLAMMDGDDGDASRVAMLERRAESLRRQIAEAQDMIAPPQARDLDPVEAASRAAHEVFREVTRAAWEAAQSGTARPAPRERPPFGSVSRGASAEHTGPDCRVCAAARERDAARAREDAVAVYGEIAR
jgi:murein DD-endopeptidase MepM/ murein hydrolase activator NlpD